MRHLASGSWIRLGAAAALAGLTSACLTGRVAAAGPEAVVFGSEGREAEARAVLATVRDYAPLVAEVLGVDMGRPRIFLEDQPLDGAFAETRWRLHLTWIRIGSEVGDFLKTILVHELVHYGAFRSRWRRLPFCMHEGLAYWLQLQLVELQNRGMTMPAPSAELLDQVLSFSESEHRARPLSTERNWAATWLVSRLGLGRLEMLIARAEREGQRLVPREWIEAALPEPREESATLATLLVVTYLDAQGSVVARKVASLDSPSAHPTGEQAVQLRIDRLVVPPYSGPFFLLEAPEAPPRP